MERKQNSADKMFEAGAPDWKVVHWNQWEEGDIPYHPETWLTSDEEFIIKSGWDWESDTPTNFPTKEEIDGWAQKNKKEARRAFPYIFPPEEAPIIDGGEVPDKLPIFDFLGEERTDIQLKEDPNSEIVYMQMDEHKLEAPTVMRVSQCGRLWHRCDWKTGMRKGFYYKCDLFLYCPRCARDRADLEQGRVLAHVKDQALYQVVVPVDGDSAPLVRNVDSDMYRRYPVETGETIILTTDENVEGAELVADPRKLDWKMLTQTPKGQRYSGKMLSTSPTVPKKEDDEQEEIKRIEVVTYTFSHPKSKNENDATKDYQRAWDFAVLATAHIPCTFDNIEMAIAERMRHFRSSIEELGYKTNCVIFGYDRVVKSEIDWAPYNLYIRDKLRKEGYTNEALELNENLVTTAIEGIAKEATSQ